MSDTTTGAIDKEILEGPLKDVEAIHTERPDFTVEQWEVISKASNWMKATLRPDVRKELDAEYAKRYGEDIESLRAEMKKKFDVEVRQWRESQNPLDDKELSKLLTQEYVTIPVKVMERKNKQMVERSFTLCELPKSAEKKFVDCAKQHLVKIIEQASATEWDLSQTTAKQLQYILESLPSALDAAVELATICLNPWEDEEDVTIEWVANNFSCYRISCILIAQCEVNKYRDFFSNGFRLFQMSKTMA